MALFYLKFFAPGGTIFLLFPVFVGSHLLYFLSTEACFAPQQAAFSLRQQGTYYCIVAHVSRNARNVSNSEVSSTIPLLNFYARKFNNNKRRNDNDVRSARP